MRRILGKIIDANKKFHLIEPGDRIAVGVSGGKDSVTLLYALHLFRGFSQIDFEVVGITLQMGFPDMDFDPIIKFCAEKGIEYHLVPTNIYDVLQKTVDKRGKIQCALCSKFKKAFLIKEAKSYNCNKVSMAHHFDDGIETLFMNAIYNGFLGSFKPKMFLDDTEIMFIRPLILAEEKVIERVVAKNHLPVVRSTCPNDKHTSREEVKQWLNEDFYKRFPTAKINFKNMMLHPERVILWDENDQKERAD